MKESWDDIPRHLRPKSAILAFLLWALFGIAGAHWLYLRGPVMITFGLAQACLAVWVGLYIADLGIAYTTADIRDSAMLIWRAAMKEEPDAMATVGLAGIWIVGGGLLPGFLVFRNESIGLKRWRWQAMQVK